MRLVTRPNQQHRQEHAETAGWLHAPVHYEAALLWQAKAQFKHQGPVCQLLLRQRRPRRRQDLKHVRWSRPHRQARPTRRAFSPGREARSRDRSGTCRSRLCPPREPWRLATRHTGFCTAGSLTASVSRNDHGFLACGLPHAELRKQSVDVHHGPSLSEAVVTQIVTQPDGLKCSDTGTCRSLRPRWCSYI